MDLQGGVSILDSLIITLFSMGTVFLTLIIISFILEAFKIFFYKKEDVKTLVKKDGMVSGTNQDELIAVITAALEAHDEENTVAAIAGALAVHHENLNIKSIKRVS